jgi:hypothetical protein
MGALNYFWNPIIGNMFHSYDYISVCQTGRSRLLALQNLAAIQQQTAGFPPFTAGLGGYPISSNWITERAWGYFERFNYAVERFKENFRHKEIRLEI